MPIYEPGLEQLVTKKCAIGTPAIYHRCEARCRAGAGNLSGRGNASKPDGSPDLSFVDDAARSIADHMNGYKVIVTKSTVPIGTGDILEN